MLLHMVKVGYAMKDIRKMQSEQDVLNMTPEEKLEQLRIIQLRGSISNDMIEYDGEEFSLRDVQRKCEVYRYSENYGELECRGSVLRRLARKCEAHFSDQQDESGEIECRGSDLRIIERKCEATMYSDDYGEITCR